MGIPSACPKHLCNHLKALCAACYALYFCSNKKLCGASGEASKKSVGLAGTVGRRCLAATLASAAAAYMTWNREQDVMPSTGGHQKGTQPLVTGIAAAHDALAHNKA